MMITINATVTETTPPTIATVLPDGSFVVSTTTMKIFYMSSMHVYKKYKEGSRSPRIRTLKGLKHSVHII